MGALQWMHGGLGYLLVESDDEEELAFNLSLDLGFSTFVSHIKVGVYRRRL